MDGFIFEQRQLRQESIGNLEFPFEYREGQRELVVSVYKTINRGKTLYIQAPTGVGKTIATIFPAVAAMGQNKADKIFYLIIKNDNTHSCRKYICIVKRKWTAFQDSYAYSKR